MGLNPSQFREKISFCKEGGRVDERIKDADARIKAALEPLGGGAYTLRVRVPAWAKSAKMSTATRDGDYLVIDKTFGNSDFIFNNKDLGATCIFSHLFT